MRDQTPQHRPNPDDSALLAKAFFRASDLLNLTQDEQGKILGISSATLSRRTHKTAAIAPAGREGETALLFLRIFRSLDALFGGREADMRKWFDADNHYLKGIPRNLVKSLQGLFDVVSYLDAMRAQV